MRRCGGRLCRALVRRGHHVVFFERDVPYYAGARDLHRLPASSRCSTRLGRRPAAGRARRCAAPMSPWSPPTAPMGSPPRALRARRRRPAAVFYDLDTPVTLDRLDAGERPDYLARDGLARLRPGAELYRRRGTGAAAAAARRAARRAALWQRGPRRASAGRAPMPAFAADLSYLGTYAADRQPALETAVRRAGATAARAPLRDRRRAYPDGFPLDAEHLLPPPSCRRRSIRPSSPLPGSR